MRALFSFLVIQVLLFASNVKPQILDNDFTFGKDLLEDIKKIDFPKNMDNILKNDPIRNITLYEELKKRNQVEEVGGAVYLSKLSQNISYSIDDSMQRGMELYFKLAAKNGLINDDRQLVFV